MRYIFTLAVYFFLVGFGLQDFCKPTVDAAVALAVDKARNETLKEIQAKGGLKKAKDDEIAELQKEIKKLQDAYSNLELQSVDLKEKSNRAEVFVQTIEKNSAILKSLLSNDPKHQVLIENK